MPVHNRTLGGSEQDKVLDFNLEVPITTGQTGLLAYIPFPCLLRAGQLAAFSIESNPNLLLTVSRFIPGQGATSWNLGSTFTMPSFGTSGVLVSGISLPATGSTLLLLMANDVLGYISGGGSTAGIFGCVGGFVVRPLQDIRQFLGGLV